MVSGLTGRSSAFLRDSEVLSHKLIEYSLKPGEKNSPPEVMVLQRGMSGQSGERCQLRRLSLHLPWSAASKIDWISAWERARSKNSISSSVPR